MLSQYTLVVSPLHQEVALPVPPSPKRNGGYSLTLCTNNRPSGFVLEDTHTTVKASAEIIILGVYLIYQTHFLREDVTPETLQGRTTLFRTFWNVGRQPNGVPPFAKKPKWGRLWEGKNQNTCGRPKHLVIQHWGWHWKGFNHLGRGVFSQYWHNLTLDSKT